jgi:hypothetical protein
MAEGDNDHQEDIVSDGVDDAVVTDPNSKPWPAAQPPRGRRSWILCQKRDGSLDARLNCWIELRQRPDGSRP